MNLELNLLKQLERVKMALGCSRKDLHSPDRKRLLFRGGNVLLVIIKCTPSPSNNRMCSGLVITKMLHPKVTEGGGGISLRFPPCGRSASVHVFWNDPFVKTPRNFVFPAKSQNFFLANSFCQSQPLVCHQVCSSLPGNDSNCMEIIVFLKLSPPVLFIIS